MEEVEEVEEVEEGGEGVHSEFVAHGERRLRNTPELNFRATPFHLLHLLLLFFKPSAGFRELMNACSMTSIRN